MPRRIELGRAVNSWGFARSLRALREAHAKSCVLSLRKHQPVRYSASARKGLIEPILVEMLNRTVGQNHIANPIMDRPRPTQIIGGCRREDSWACCDTINFEVSIS